MATYDMYPVVFCKASRLEYGSASIEVGRKLPHDRFCFAVFLVDFWKLGLKDAFGSTKMDANEFTTATSTLIADNEMAGIELDSIKIEEAKRRIVRGMRIAGAVGTPPPDKTFLEVLGNIDGFEAKGSLYKCYACGVGELDSKICNEILTVAKRELKSGVAGLTTEEKIYYECRPCWSGTKVNGKSIPYPWC